MTGNPVSVRCGELLVAGAILGGRHLGRARAALAIVFFVNGALVGSWVSRIPAIRDRVGASTGPLGLALLGIALGGLASKPLAGSLVSRFGSGPVTRLGIVASSAALALPGLASDVPTLGLALVALGAAMGIADVGMNAHAVALEARAGRAIMSSLHGSYSVGGLGGAIAGGWASGAGLEPLHHLELAGLVLVVVALAATVALPSRSDPAPRAEPGGGFRSLPRDRRIAILVLGIVALCGMAGEGSAGDWSSIYLRDGLGTGPGMASAGYAAYSLAMASGRFLGDRVVTSWGGLVALRRSLVLAGAGFAAGLLAHDPRAAVAGLAALGLGLSIVVPVVISTAGQLGEGRVGPTIAVVSSISGAGAFAGPPLIGWLAEAIGLAAALGAVTLLAFTAIALLRLVPPIAAASAAADTPSLL